MTLKENVAKAAALRAELAQSAILVEAHRQKEFELKLVKVDIMQQLDEMGTTRTGYVDGTRATEMPGAETLTINDPEAFYDFLEANAKDYRQYLKPDAKLATKFAKEYRDKVGKPPDGTELSKKPYIKFEEEKESLGDLAANLSESDNPLND